MALYRRKDSDVWWVDISHPHHPRVRETTGTANRLEAQRIHDKLKADLWALGSVRRQRDKRRDKIARSLAGRTNEKGLVD